MRIIARWLFAAVCSLAALVPTEAHAAKRVALVIGNADYKIGRLANPVSDAEAMAEAFRKELKFDTVLLKKDVRLDGFREALRELGRAARGAELGVIFFAGHGIEVGGRNYLIPTDAVLAAVQDIGLEAIALDDVLRQLDGVTKLRLAILDACRNNPFPAAQRGSRGLTRIKPGGGTMVAYAAEEGTTAEDGKGVHSPFTAALLKRIVMPGVDVRRVFGYVSDDVKIATSHVQVPYLYGQLGGDEIHLVAKGSDKGPDPVGLTPGHTILALPPSPAAQAWTAAKDSTSIAALEAFRQQYGRIDAFYDRLAEERIELLRAERLALLKAEEERKRDPALGVKPGSGTGFRDRTAEGAPCPECPEMVVVPAGSFTMGSPPDEVGREPLIMRSESPQRRVTLARAFAVGKFEVTFAEWDACIAAVGCSRRPETSWGRGRQPVMDVSWDDTQQYLGWLSRRTGKAYRLPTEAEWEYVARARTTTPFWWGSSISPSQANYNGQYIYASGLMGEYRKRTLPVDSFAPNPWGLYNVHGNVSEWVQDCWNDSNNGAPTDGSAWAVGDCSRRMVRGGSWLIDPRYLRAAHRDRDPADSRYHNRGFRLARAL